MPLSDLPPTVGAWVRKSDDPDHIGWVVGIHTDDFGCTVEVNWGPRGQERVPVDNIECGLIPDFVVQDEPLSATRKTLGPARVVAIRRIADCDQALVQLEEDGRLLWLPYQTLKRIKDPALQFFRAEMTHVNSGERWAVRIMAHALRSWNEATGALDRLDVDPLPHQIQLVHKILISGHNNWLIADDVGLGKTIEVGLLLGALERQGRAKRILIVTPAGLTRQWQDEMRVKFDRIFEIYDADFSVDETWKWKLHDRVIASLDLVKPRSGDDLGIEQTTHFGRLLASENWDLVVFDEAHRLSRTDDGSQTLRFKLARALRSRTDGMLLLSGTPHQGDTGRFRSLLQLVRPDLARAVQDLEFNPEIVADIIVRNRKTDVTDLDGNFIFRGHTVHRFGIKTTDNVRNLDLQLRQYLRRAYSAGRRIGGRDGRAIGFVMTIYRKLASSSVAALREALKRRLDRLETGITFNSPRQPAQSDLDLEEDDLTSWEIEDATKPFFAEESGVLRGLISACEVALEDDVKLQAIRAALTQLVINQKEKVLVFTEYRATQSYLIERLSSDLNIKIALINGSQSINEKLENVSTFEADAPVLVSTEAGGEGFNLHRGCCFLINYDLPWNPARLVQRIGRLYRYGQSRPVTVLNFHAKDTIDNEIIDLALARVETIVNELAPLGPEFGEGYKSEVLGEMLDQLDLSTILNGDLDATISFTRDQVEQAVERAKRARELQSEMFEYAGHFHPEELARLGNYTTRNVAEFAQRAASLCEIKVEPFASNPERFRLRLPETLRGQFAEFGARTVVEATTSRRAWSPTSSLALLDFGSDFFRYLIGEATSAAFGGGYAAVNREIAQSDVAAAFLGRWQNDQGELLDHQLFVARKSGTGQIEVDNRVIAGLFKEPVETLAPRKVEAPFRKELLDALRDRVEVEMIASVSRFRHPNDLVLLAIGEEGIASEIAEDLAASAGAPSPTDSSRVEPSTSSA